MLAPCTNTEASYRMEGLLWKRARGRSFSSVLFRPWALRWFAFEDGKLTYHAVYQGLSGAQRRTGFGAGGLQQRGGVLVENCEVRTVIEANKQYAFVVSGCQNLESGAKETLHLAATTEDEMKEWISALSGRREKRQDRWVWVCDRYRPQGQPATLTKAYSRKASHVTAFYEVGKVVGSGGFAVVKKATCLREGSIWALKVVPENVVKTNFERLEEEVKILASLRHPGIVKLREVIRTPNEFAIVMEFLDGGELFSRIVERKCYNEFDAKVIAAKILEPLRYLHENDIVHRDVKPENIMFDTKDENNAQLKLTDFGFATMYKDVGLTATCGTPEYVAPEILLEKPYDKAVDMWSFGVVVYILLCGFPPFYGRTQAELFKRVCSADYKYLKPFWNHVSDEAKDLIDHLLDTNPDTRFTAQQALEHSWFNEVVRGSGVSTQSSADLSNVIRELRRYNGYRRFRNGVLAVIAANRLKTQVLQDALLGVYEVS